MDSKIKILFENNGDNLNFDKNLNYCYYIKGCFCPPHKGHIDIIKKYINNNNNTYLIVNQIGSKSRHGVDKIINFKVIISY